MRPLKIGALVALWLAAIVAANLTLAHQTWGPNTLYINCFFMVGLTFVTRDRLADFWDWVQLPRGKQLHAIGTITNDADEDWYGDGTTVCGKKGEMRIPGIFTRMSAQRCVACCTKTGMPLGNQSPKNADECRPVVEARLAALRVAVNPQEDE